MLLHFLKKYMFQLLSKGRLLYHAGQPMQLSDSGRFEDSLCPEPWAVIVGRQHYSEWIKRYPVADESELMSILRSQQSAGNYAIYQIGPLLNRQRTVQCWQIDEQLLELYPTAVLWVPESLLLKSNLSECPVVRIQSPAYFYFAALQDDHLISAAQTSMLNSAEMFCSSNGLPMSDAVEIKVTPDLIKHSLFNISWADVWRCFRFRFSDEFKRELLLLLKVTTGLFVAYQLLASLYLLSLNLSFSAEQDAQMQQIEQMLKVQNQLQQDTELLTAQQQILAGKVYSYQVWALMAGLLKQQVELTNVQYSDKKIVLRGQASSATEVLSFLKQQSLVQRVEFESAVRRQGDKESFVILVQLKAETV